MTRRSGIFNEDSFQKWVVQRFRGLVPGGHVLDLSAVGGDVPDLNVACCDYDADEAGSGYEYWLELKFDWFRLGHSRYDDFEWSQAKRGQLEWLSRRAHQRTARCGVLGYARSYGIDKTHSVDYLIFHTVEQYLEEVWMKKPQSGGVFLGPRATPAHSINTGRDLIKFIDHAAVARLENEYQLSR